MKTLDKVLAGLILLGLAAFWGIVSPSAISSRHADAAPVTLEVAKPETPKKPEVRRAETPKPARKRRSTQPADPALKPQIIINADGTETRIFPKMY